MKLINLIDKSYGRLKVIARAGTKGHEPTWLCNCICGNKKIIIGSELRKGNTISCGCYAKEIAKATALKHIAGKNKTHGKAGTLIYKQWSEMKRRCYNPNDTSYKQYGGRGIQVCESWQNSFQAFYDYVSKLPHFRWEGYTLDRINNDGNYEPGNVRWATAKEQANNRRTGQNLRGGGANHGC